MAKRLIGLFAVGGGVAVGVGYFVQKPFFRAASVQAEEPALPARWTEKYKVFGDRKTQEEMEGFLIQLQHEICRELDKVEKEYAEKTGKKCEGKWVNDRHERGYTRVFTGGGVFEKAGCALSVIQNEMPGLKAKHLLEAHNATGIDFTGNPTYFAAGLSLVFHPQSPLCPTVHFNYRYFEFPTLQDKEGRGVWWFAGGSDLTPTFVVDGDPDAKHFHETLKAICDKTSKEFYPKFKKECDDYFIIQHRQEARGVGGIFFDYTREPSKEAVFDFIRNCGNGFIPSYFPIIRKHFTEPFTADQKSWQQLRRGRYAEYNLVYDRGTKFGLATPDARTESVLMSLPLTARWEYNRLPTTPAEKATIDILKHPREWAA